MEKLVFEVAVEMVSGLVEGTKFIAQENKTGVTFMAGKQRLVKIVNTKKGLKLEVNLELSKNLESKLSKSGDLMIISKAMAHQKHLGTMKYLYKSIDTTDLENVIKELLGSYAKLK